MAKATCDEKAEEAKEVTCEDVVVYLTALKDNFTEALDAGWSDQCDELANAVEFVIGLARVFGSDSVKVAA